MKIKEWKKIYNKYWGFKWWYSKKKREKILMRDAEVKVDWVENSEGNYDYKWEVKKRGVSDE